MMSHHLTDHEIQEYISALMQHEPHEALKHLVTCEACNKEVNDYLLLMSDIKKQERPSFDFDVSTLVLSQLPIQKKGKVQETIYAYYEVILAILVLFGLLYYYRKTLYLLFSASLLINLLMITTAALIMMFLIYDMHHRYQKKMMILHNM